MSYAAFYQQYVVHLVRNTDGVTKGKKCISYQFKKLTLSQGSVSITQSHYINIPGPRGGSESIAMIVFFQKAALRKAIQF